MTISLDIRDAATALALAQAAKRMTDTIAARLAADEPEAYQILAGMDDLRASLADAGYAPR